MSNRLLFIYMLITNASSIVMSLLPIFMYILKCLNIHVYKITNRETINMLKHIFMNDFCSGYTEDNIPFGIIIPKSLKYCGYVNDDNNRSITIITTKSIYNQITSRDRKLDIIEIPNISIKNEIQYWTRTGDYMYISYHKRNIQITYDFNIKQNEIFQNIMLIYKKKSNVKCYIYGDMDVGKTMFSYIAAKQLSGSICDSFNPTEPSDSFDNMYTSIHPTAECPLILLMDEIDMILKKVHDTVPSNKRLITYVHNKTTWNNMLDKIDYGLYPYVILILCSNKSYNEISKLDSSYLRKGRIDIVEHMSK